MRCESWFFHRSSGPRRTARRDQSPQPGLRQLGRIGNEQRVIAKPPHPTQRAEKMAPASSLGKQGRAGWGLRSDGRMEAQHTQEEGPRPATGTWASADSSTCRLRAILRLTFSRLAPVACRVDARMLPRGQSQTGHCHRPATQAGALGGMSGLFL